MTKGRIMLTAAGVGALVLALAAPAYAHVTVNPVSAPQGSTTRLSFLVPDEEAPATVTEVQIFFPTPPDTPIPSVTVGQVPGWKAKITSMHLSKPIVTDDGSIADIVSEIDWKATTPSARIKAGEFGEFPIDADGLPTDETQVVFKAFQTYSNGDIVKWIDPVTPGGPEADHPTPILELTPANDGATPTTAAPATPSGSQSTTVAAASTKDNSARALGIIAIVLGAVALLAATGALMRRRRAA